jgi:hypothetical protein
VKHYHSPPFSADAKDAWRYTVTSQYTLMVWCSGTGTAIVIHFFLSFFLSISVSSQCAGSEVKPLTEDRGCDSVLLGQSNRTPHGVVIDEYAAMVE